MKLSVTDLFKPFPRSTKLRLEHFISKYVNKEPFELDEISGRKVKLVYDSETEAVLRKALVKKNSQLVRDLVFKDTKNRAARYKVSSFKKTAEFGGIPERAASSEEQAIAKINDILTSIKAELGSSFVPMTFRGKRYNITECVNTPGFVKSDFHFVDDRGNEVMWFSYKTGRSPQEMLQWGGMTEQPISEYPETKEFVRLVMEKYPDGIPPTATVAREIFGTNADAIKKKSIYGIGYDQGVPLGRQNVSMVLQGDVKILKSGTAYKISAAHKYENGHDVIGDFAPIFMVRFATDRSNFNIKNARFTISPRGGRSITDWIT